MYVYSESELKPAFQKAAENRLEMITSVFPKRKIQPVAIGNVIGADILNVLFVAGAAAAVTPAGLEAAPEFFRLQFPAMLSVLITLRIAILMARGDKLPRWAGYVLVGFYALYLPLTFILR